MNIAQADNRASQHGELKSFVIESLTAIRDNCMSRLIVGTCGKFDFNVLGDVAQILLILLRTSNSSDIKSTLLSSLQEDHFLLGDEAKNATFSTLFRWADNSNLSHLDSRRLFLEDIWKLHQVEDSDVLAASDEVARFIKTYAG
jgi:hypothetical protein